MENQLEVYQSILEEAVDAIFIGEPNGNHILVNKAAEELTGYNKKELLSLNIMNLFSEQTLNIDPLNYEALNSGSVITMEREIIKKDGTSVPVEMKSKKLSNGNLQSIVRDNSEKLKSKQELKESEEKYKILFESSPSGILFATSDGTIINANRTLREMLGYTESDLVGKNVSDISHPDSRNTVKYNLEKILTGETLNHVVKSIKRDGSAIFNLLYEKKVRIEGYGDCIISIANDITKQINAENKLKEIEEVKKNILEHSNNVFYSHTINHEITYISPQIKQLLGYEPEEAMIKWTDLITDNPINEIAFKKTSEAISTGIKQKPYQVELKTKDGKVKIVEVNEDPVVVNGKTVSIVGALIDITEKKKAELALAEAKEQFQFAIEGSDVGVWDWQVQTGETVFNEKWANIIGYSLAELQPVSIDTWIHFCHPDDLPVTRKLLNEHFNGGTDTYEAEFRMKHKSGKWVWILDRGKVVQWDEDKRPIRMVGTHLDITERKQVDKELRDSEERFKSLFEDAAVPIWLEDFSELKIRFDELKKAGIKDFKKYFDKNPKEVEELAGMVKVLDVNRKSLELYNVPDKESLVKDLSKYFSAESLEVFKEELVALANGKNTFVSDIPIIAPSGETFHLIINLSVPPASLNTLDRVLVSFFDITERKKNSQIINKYAQEIETFFSLSQNMIGNLNSQELINIIPQHAVNAMGNVEAASLWKFNNEEKVFQPISWHGYGNLDISNTRLSLDDTLIGNIYTSQKGIICNNTLSEPSFKRIDTVNSSLIKSTIGLPLIVNEEIIGIVFADNLSATNIFDEEDFKVLQSFVNFSAVAFNNAQLYDMLKESEQKYHSIVDSIGESILIHDFETGMIKDVNKNVLEMYGVDFEEALNLGPDETSSGIYPYTAEEAFKMLNKAKTEGPQLFEWYAKRKNGELFWTEVNLRKTLIDNEERILAVVRDIDERKKIEEAIKLSEAKTETIMRSAPVGIGFIKNRILQYVNEHLLTLLGYSEDEMVGHSSSIFYSTIDDFEKIGDLYKELETKTSVSAEAKVKRKDGKIIDLIIGLSPIDRYNIEKGVIFSVLDITESKAARQKLLREQARYKSLFELSPIPIAEEDVTEIFTYLDELKKLGIADTRKYFNENPEKISECFTKIRPIKINEEILHLYGVQDFNEYKKNFYKFFTSHSLDSFKEQLISFSKGKMSFSNETELLTLSGDLRHVIMKIQLLPSRSSGEYIQLLTLLDITERKHIEDELKLSEEKFSKAFFNSPNAISLSSLEDGKILEINEFGAKALGYRHDEIVGKTSIELNIVTEEDRNKIFHELEKNGAYSDLELEVHTKSGETRIGLFYGHPLTIGQKNFLFQTITDITEIRNAEKDLKDSEEKFSAAFHSSMDAYAISRFNDGVIIDANEVFCKMFDVKLENVLGKTTLDLGIYKNKADRKKTYDLLKKQYFVRNMEAEFMTVNKKRSGYAQFSINKIDLQGEIYLFTTIRDITDRIFAENEIKKQLERNKLILDTMNDGFILADENGNIVDVNPSYCNLVGYTAEELTKMNIREIEVSIPKDEVDRRIKQIISKGVDSFNTKHKTKKGEIIDLAVSIAVTTFENKTLVSAFVRDITLQSMTLKELNKSREEIGELAQHLQEVREEERQSIAAEIHDDLGQALTALKLDTSILMSKVSDKDESVVTKLKSMKLLTDQSIKTVQKISSDLRPGILDDLGLTAALEWETNKFEERTGIRCNLIISPYDISFDDKINITVFRLVQEACTNVARHSKATELEITITQELTKLNLVIKDNGIGITREQINNSKSFGLFGMRERLRNLKGGINFTGEPNKGTTVNIVIPLNSASKK